MTLHLIQISPLIILLASIFLFPKNIAAISLVLGLCSWGLLPGLTEEGFGSVERSPVIKAFKVSLDILLILVGALLFLDIQKKTGALKQLLIAVGSVSQDHRVLVVLMAWCLGAFFEGLAGFGSPAMIVAPLLLVLGVSPILAATVCLMANSTPVSFGAFGTPLRIGFQGLDVTDVASRVATLHFFAGALMPSLMMLILLRGQKEFSKRWLEIFPFSFFAGLSFVIPSTLLAGFGGEWSSVVGALVSLGACILCLKMKLFSYDSVFRFSEREEEVLNSNSQIKSWIQGFSPYFFLLMTLLLLRFLGIRNPAYGFFVLILGFIALKQVRFWDVRDSVVGLIPRMSRTAISIFGVCLVVYSVLATGGLTGLVRGLSIEEAPWMALVTGALGAFVAGSATVSNLIFAPVLDGLLPAGDAARGLVFAFQLAGAALGNMISLTNVIAVSTVLSLDSEHFKNIYFKVFPVFLFYILSVFGTGFFLEM